jgi:hypothetical protein
VKEIVIFSKAEHEKKVLAQQRLAPRKPFTIDELDSKLLDAILELKKLTAEQLTRRYFNAGSLTSVKNRLTILEREKFIDHDTLSKLYIYFLARMGRAYFIEAEEDIKEYYRPSKEKGHPRTEHYHQMLHLLELNDILITARLFPKYSPHFTLTRLLHDYDLRHEPLFVVASRQIQKRVEGIIRSEWKEETVGVVPDALMEFIRMPSRIPGKPFDSYGIWLEHNRTGGAGRFKQKIRAILEVIAIQRQKALVNTETLKVAITTSGGEFRKRHLRTLTEQVLEERATKDQGTAFSPAARKLSMANEKLNVFYFATTPPFGTGCIVPQTFFQAKIWFKPFSAKPTSLLPRKS